ncbi:flagellar hook-basal body complex protein FliE [Cellulomonas sp. SLBN-39]|uniref:flagellar hook-basal body complex protein FliE n=1 Tax=Cellulomonas sp. SLBN-39 TaxID=2768446 RepID=UPI001151215D|nr:flagellar hook-basal body complex protein FliE [Cellulomonas sp. SLBN-39]
MAIAPVAGVTGVQPAAMLGQVAPTTPASTGVDFASVLGSVDQLQQMQSTSQQLAVQAVTGDLDDVHDYTVASAQSSLALELTATVRNKAVEAFTEIMRMQV